LTIRGKQHHLRICGNVLERWRLTGLYELLGLRNWWEGRSSSQTIRVNLGEIT